MGDSVSTDHDWPEPVVPVQSIADSGAAFIPTRYVKPPADRPTAATGRQLDIPAVDLGHLAADDPAKRQAATRAISDACRDWGFFQAVNHGVDGELVRAVAAVWSDFFHLPVAEKKKLANSPTTYEGYGSRLGVEKDASLDWGDYFFLNLLPKSARNHDKWPKLPLTCRETTEEYGRQTVKLCGAVMKALSVGLGLHEGFLEEKFGGEGGAGACMRVCYYPKCPQPELTLGLSAHSDPGGLTVLLAADDCVPGLQVRRGHEWVPVRPLPGALIVNVGDQIQVLSNATFKSVEHRVVVNAMTDRLSIAFFYNPNGNLLLEPAKELVTLECPPLYHPMTFNQYRQYIRKNGPRGKAQVESHRIIYNNSYA
ncbi:Protein SRG1 [Apostasia shenzhenica]|uniref:Protein SRG1 n=1 Tax=Apostasia shenzhenica TaxID=1088818 RepID=A0A2I0B683_9ASPA|nr:Protein SRG1 [Apostasia shenzhenica]